MTLSAYLENNFQNPRVGPFLTPQWPYYGLHPERASMAAQAIVHHHCGKGAWYPSHGADQFARRVESVVERHGGIVMMQVTADRILVENGRVVSVTAILKGEDQPIELRAPAILASWRHSHSRSFSDRSGCRDGWGLRL